MRTEQELKERIAQYLGVEYIYKEGLGYIVWHLGSGDNYEILFLEVSESARRQKIGRKLFEEFKAQVKPSFHSVYVFHLKSNLVAAKFYESLGFVQFVECGIYRGEPAILRWVEFSKLFGDTV